MARETIDVDKLIRQRKAFDKNSKGVAYNELLKAKENSKNIFNTYFFQDKGREHGADRHTGQHQDPAGGGGADVGAHNNADGVG